MAERPGLQNLVAALAEALRGHNCPADDRITVGECVDRKDCGCSDGLLLQSAAAFTSAKGEKP